MILISACLVGVNCKYDGGNNLNEKILELVKNGEAILVCPEQLGGLTTPRVPSERLNDKVITKEGIDVTKNFERGAKEVTNLAKKLNIKKAILKSRSPSCGYGKIYNGEFNNTLIQGNGILTDMLLKENIEIISSDDFK